MCKFYFKCNYSISSLRNMLSVAKKIVFMLVLFISSTEIVNYCTARQPAWSINATSYTCQWSTWSAMKRLVWNGRECLSGYVRDCYCLLTSNNVRWRAAKIKCKNAQTSYLQSQQDVQRGFDSNILSVCSSIPRYYWSAWSSWILPPFFKDKCGNDMREERTRFCSITHDINRNLPSSDGCVISQYSETFFKPYELIRQNGTIDEEHCYYKKTCEPSDTLYGGRPIRDATQKKTTTARMRKYTSVGITTIDTSNFTFRKNIKKPSETNLDFATKNDTEMLLLEAVERSAPLSKTSIIIIILIVLGLAVVAAIITLVVYKAFQAPSNASASANFQMPIYQSVPMEILPQTSEAANTSAVEKHLEASNVAMSSAPPPSYSETSGDVA